MILAIDVGNTNITLGVFNGSQLVKKASIPTKEKNLLPKLKAICSKNKIEDAALCSVVPETTKLLENCLKKILKKKPYILGKNISVPIKNLYRKPKEVGQDRLVNAYAGVVLYGAPLVVVDFGTAITFDVITKDKEYLGGMILPGLRISLDALWQKTALLPQISLSIPGELIGRDTKQSMLSGIVYGVASLTDDLSERIKEKIGRDALVIGTGGDVNLISSYCKNLDSIDPHLTLKGLNLIFQGRSL